MKTNKVKLTWHHVGTFHGDLNAWILEAKYKGETYIFKVAQSQSAGIIYDNFFREESNGAFEEYLTQGTRLDERLESLIAEIEGTKADITAEDFVKLFISAGGDMERYENGMKIYLEGR